MSVLVGKHTKQPLRVQEKAPSIDQHSSNYWSKKKLDSIHFLEIYLHFSPHKSRGRREQAPEKLILLQSFKYVKSSATECRQRKEQFTHLNQDRTSGLSLEAKWKQVHDRRTQHKPNTHELFGEALVGEPWKINFLNTLFFYKNQEMSAEARMFLILIHIFSNSHPTPNPNICLKCFSWP